MVKFIGLKSSTTNMPIIVRPMSWALKKDPQPSRVLYHSILTRKVHVKKII